MVLLPIGIPLGLVGLLLTLWALFYSTPAVAPGEGHGHGTGAAGH